ncbi:putative lipoprotein YgdR precursor [compost metagenome]
MKKSILAALCAIALTGCANEYLIVTNDGTLVSTQEKPELDQDTGMMEFEDDEGRKQQIPKESIKSVIER